MASKHFSLRSNYIIDSIVDKKYLCSTFLYHFFKIYFHYENVIIVVNSLSM